VLDNLEQVLDSAPLLDELLSSAPDLKILATSRTSLRLYGEHEFPVPPLSLPDPESLPPVELLTRYEAVRLFVERAMALRPDFSLTEENAPAVVEICARLDGLPLAIELAAARTKLLPPRAMLTRLGNRLKLLTGGAQNLPERQRTLRSTIEWSYEMLDAGEMSLFGRLAVFSGGATLEAIEVVCNPQGDLPVDTLEGVSSLLDDSLLRQEEGAEDEPRFVMLETIHEYARERLEEQWNAQAIKRAHAEYFLALAEEAEPGLWGPEDAAWLDRLDQEHDNMRTALSWAIEHEEAELALRLGGALRWFWFMEGYYGEGRRWLEAALGKDRGAAEEARARALEGVGWLASGQGDLDRAQAVAEEGLKLTTEAGLGNVVAADLRNVLGEVARQRGDYEWAVELLEESLALHREAEDRRGIAWSLGNLANASGDLGDHDRAKELYEEGLALSRELGGAELLGAYLISLGYEFLLEGNPESATALNEEAVKLYRKRGHRGRLQAALDNLGWAALVRGDHQRAATLHEESLMLCKDLGDKLTGSESLEGLACSAAARGEAERAAKLFGAAEALRDAGGYWQEYRERALREPYLTAARSRMDQASWESAFAAGQAMVFEEAAEYALSKEADPDRPTFPASEAPSDGQLPVTLTSREQEVAVLVAQGLSNRQIASYLTLSEHTIATHIRNILKKLGLHSRTQIAAYFREQH
jgi:predicted ATPase/DNA-binding CsgD family transcriptional regulator